MDVRVTPQDVRDYLVDSPENNHLLDGIEFTDKRIELCKKAALSDYNVIPPRSNITEETFLSFGLMLDGICYHLFKGQLALAARNQMSYTDGGLNIPIEERFTYYQYLMDFYRQQFQQKATELKKEINMESMWGSISSDYVNLPNW